MKWKIFDKLEGSFKPSFKCNGAAVASAAGDIVGGILSVYNTDNTNHYNRQIARENREWQSKENEIQRAWEVEQKDVERAYNTPAAQMQRYKEAGLNPFLMSQGGVDNGASIAPSAPAPTGAPALPHMQTADFSFFGRAVERALQATLVEANADNQQAQMVKTYTEAANEAYRNGNKELGNKILDIGLREYGKSSSDISYIQQMSHLSIRQQQISNQMQQFEYELRSKYGDKQAQANLNILQKNYDKISKDIDVANTSIKLMEAEEQLKHAQTARERQQIQLVIAQTKEALSSAYEKFAAGALHEADTLTKDQVRSYYIKTVQLKALDDELSYGANKAEYEGDAFWRDWLTSDKGKKKVKQTKALDYNPLIKGTKQFTDAVGDLIPSIIIPVP